ncbi:MULTISPECIES: YkvA family protein [Ferrimonas]|uniref:YkvA family protein n=1 Tax=Ferrimonas TaxID=44011 RepID=UPI0003F8BBDE|nr:MULTISPECIES: YkvA family protein [Ferrimonas]USD38928.1 DUF1232 domain-containing protein [Ferrimonas sp. SCSIO 43195]
MDDYAKYFSEDSFWDTLRRYAVRIGREAVEKALVLYFCLTDPQTPTQAKTVIVAALGYLILPMDVIPDLTPGVGFSDDLGALTVALATVAAHVTSAHWQRASQQLQQWFGTTPQ